MSDVLSPLRHVYDVDPTGPALVPGDTGYAEHVALHGVRSLLDGLPREAPAPGVITAVEARAADAAVGLAAVRAVYDGGPITDSVEAEALRQSRALLDAAAPPLRPSADAITAILARAAEAIDEIDLFEGASPVEQALYVQSLAALDRLARPRPDAGVIAAVEAKATESSAFDPFGAVVARAFAQRPQPRPSAEATTAILARAAEAMETEPDLFDGASAVETALYAQTLHALDRLARPRPDDAALDAVRRAAATASAEAARLPAAPARVAEDRPAVPAVMLAASRSRRAPAGAWLGGAALVLAALVAAVVLPFGGVADEAPALAEVVSTEEAAPRQVVQPQTRDADAAPTPSLSAPPSPTMSAPGFAPVAEVRRAATRTSDPAISEPLAAASRAADRPTKTPAWEASDDVRALSLRLQELDDVALAWDEPSEAIGTPATATLGNNPGLQSVREGAAPARARLRTDSSSVQR